MGNNNEDFDRSEPECIIEDLGRVQGTAAREPGQGPRSVARANGTADYANSHNTLPPLFGNAKEEPNQGPRNSRSGAGGTARLEGRGTMEQK